MATKKKSHGKGTIDSCKELKEDVKTREKTNGWWRKRRFGSEKQHQK